MAEHDSNVNQRIDCLAGGGEMGALMRALDWSKTPLGPVESWSAALRMMVRFLLANRFPLLLWWGPEYISIYNDSYRSILGTKHPWALSRPVSECWSEIWNVLKPLIDKPFHGGPPTWMEDICLEINRHGFLEETHFTIAYSPVPDEAVSSGIGGVLATVHEITEKVIGERRVGTLRDLGAKLSEAKTSEEACVISAQALSAHETDIPFLLLYQVDPHHKKARLSGSAGVATGMDISPEVIDISDAGHPWEFAQAVEEKSIHVVSDLSNRFAAVPQGPWTDRPNAAAVLPIHSNNVHELAAVMVVGISARLKFDQYYRDFLELVRAQVTTALINASAFEHEKKRAEMLSELDRAKTAFFSNVSHEFRTPLTLMLGPIEHLLSRNSDELPAATRNELELVQRNGTRLLRLVNTLLDFSRIEAGRVQARYRPVDIAAMTADLASMFRSAVERAGLRLQVDCSPMAEPVYVDSTMWEKIVMNLLSNAFKFTFDGGISVSVRQSGQTAEMQIRDTGTGIPEDQMPRLFERFHRVENARGRTHEGSGIGLAFVQELIRLHGGAIQAESEFGKGTTFTVTIPLGFSHLPVEQVDDAGSPNLTLDGANPYVEEALRWLPEDSGSREDRENEVHAAIEASTSSSSSSSLAPAPDSHYVRPLILVADDNADMRHYIQRVLSGQFRVKTVADGQAALEAIMEHPPELILSDVMMPRLDGFGLLHAVKENPKTRNIPFLLLSARAGEESRIEGLGTGADDYMVKPFSARELFARVSAHLQFARLQREATAALQASHARFEALLNAAPIGVYLVDSELRIQQVNPTALPAFEGIEEPIGKNFEEVMRTVLTKERTDHIVKRFRHTLETGAPYLEPESAEHLNRNTYEWRIHRITLSDGNYGVVCYFNDITRHVHARQALRENEERLRRSEEQLAAELASITRLHALSTRLLSADRLSEALDDVLENAIATCGADFGNIQLYDSERNVLEIASQRGFQADFLSYFQTVRVNEGSACARVLASGERIVIKDVDLDAEYEPHRKIAASAGYRAVQSTPLKTHDGRIVGILSTHFVSPTGISERDERMLDLYARHAADLVERFRFVEALRAADRHKDEFLATLSHELRNPLAPLSNGLQLIKIARNDANTIERALAMMERQLNQMVRLTNDLMDLSRISRGKVELHRERLDVSKILLQAIETSRPLIDANAHHLVVNLPSPPLHVYADLTRMSQVVSNLLNNAAKYTETGGQITLAAKLVDGEVAISVSDSGVGIPTTMLPRVFDMFTQVDRSLKRSQGGLGIGLSLVKTLVELHGGTVSAKSPGHGLGSEFTICLPVVPDLGKQDSDGTEEGSVPNRRRILVVDDNRDAALTLAAMLDFMGNQTQTAQDGVEALDIGEAFKPEVALLDIGMPRLDGYETARKIRERSWGQQVILIAVTGWGQEEDKRKATEAGFDAHTVKPIDPAVLGKMLMTLAAGRANVQKQH